MHSIKIAILAISENVQETVDRWMDLGMKGIVDFAAERERLNKELASLNKNLEGYAKKLSNPSFVERAPAAVVEEEKRRQAEALENKAKVEEALARIANF